MNLAELIVISPFTLVMAAILLLVVAAHYSLHLRTIRESRRLSRMLIAEAKKHVNQHFTVLVELDRKAESVLPLLEHLHAQDYAKLQVIVLVKHTAGKNASRQLASFKRRLGLKGLSVVMHKRGLTHETVLRRYAKGRFVMHLSTGMRLSPRFFINASYALLQRDTDVILPRMVIRPGLTIVSGFNALRAVWSAIIGHSGHKQVRPLQYGQVFKLNSLLAGKSFEHPSKRPFIDRFYVDATSEGFVWQQSLRAALIAFVSYAFVGAAVWFSFLLFENNAVEMVIVLLTALYLLSQLTFQSSLRGYTATDHVNMFLLTPFMPLYYLCKSVVRVARAARR